MYVWDCSELVTRYSGDFVKSRNMVAHGLDPQFS